jgi:hypothetical protein
MYLNPTVRVEQVGLNSATGEIDNAQLPERVAIGRLRDVPWLY